jgi:hypothetical protein
MVSDKLGAIHILASQFGSVDLVISGKTAPFLNLEVRYGVAAGQY